MPEPDQQTGANPALGAIIDVLSSGGKLDAMSLLRSQMQSQVPDDPQMAVLMRLLDRQQELEAERQTQASAGPEDSTGEGEPDTAEKHAAMSDLQDKIDSVYAELEVLRTRNDVLAAALGACYLCFGEDPVCRECQGRGVPGSRRPDPDAFRKYVLPTYRRAKQIESADAGLPRSGERRSSETNEYDPSLETRIP
jgi:hypothetical protein